MGRKVREQTLYRIAAAFDTETTNIHEDLENRNTMKGVSSGVVELAKSKTHRAFCHLYILNDLRNVQIAGYLDACEKHIDACENRISLFRDDADLIDALGDIIQDAKMDTDSMLSMGYDFRIVPVICVYNLHFDMQTIIGTLSKFYQMRTTARSGTNWYTLDLMENGKPVLRFWDMFWLDTNGLASMGKTCGVEKAVGCWGDYDSVRTPATPLTDDEKHYAKRDVIVLPAYLSWMLKAYPFLRDDDFGSIVLTKTSIVRTYAKRTIGVLRSPSAKRRTVAQEFVGLCKREQPADYDTMALRQACFRGGFTFTAGKYAMRTLYNVKSLDAVSMHHAHINGHYTPDKFRKASAGMLQRVAIDIINTTKEQVLARYWMPFGNAINALVEFDNLRPKAGSVFEAFGIWPLAMDRFVAKYKYDDGDGEDIPAETARESIRSNGYMDTADNPVFAFGKLVSASSARLFVTELELWLIGQAYDFDNMTVIGGELSSSSIVPPDYVTLQSNALYTMKKDAKHVLAVYKDGEPYPEQVPLTIPATIADGVRRGTLSRRWFHDWYASSVKGMFNGVYGTQAQNEYKPDFIVNRGEVVLDETKTITRNTFKKKASGYVLYTYGMRICGWSRVHLSIAMMLIFERFGSRAIITGGDTDSMKISVTEDISNADLLDALAPLHKATDEAISKTMRRVRDNFKAFASPLENVGHFEVEACGNSDHYVAHMEAWNKARTSMDTDGRVHVTCAGLPQPSGAYTLEDWMTDACRGDVKRFEHVAPIALGFNTIISHDICHCLETTQPNINARVEMDVTDYRGETEHIDLPEAVCVYPFDKKLGDTLNVTARTSRNYLRRIGNNVTDEVHEVELAEDGTPRVFWFISGRMENLN